MLSTSNVEKLKAISSVNDCSLSAVVRLAVDIYSPDQQKESDLLDLVAERLKEALEDTRATRARLDAALNTIELEPEVTG